MTERYTAVILCDDRVMIQHLTVPDINAASVRATELAAKHAEGEMFWSLIPGHAQAKSLMPMHIGGSQ